MGRGGNDLFSRWLLCNISFSVAIFNDTSDDVSVRDECERGTIKAEEMHQSLARHLPLRSPGSNTRENNGCEQLFFFCHFFVAYGVKPPTSIVLEM